MRISIGLLSVREFAPAHFAIRVASGFDVSGVRRNFHAELFAILDIAAVDERLLPGLALFFLEPALNLFLGVDFTKPVIFSIESPLTRILSAHSRR